jgi:hypothetical protein
LHKYAELLLESYQNNIDSSVADTLFVLSGNNFDANKEKLIDELKDNKRRFIISAYQTIGVGQNLQFPIPFGIEPIHINSFPKHSNMDINGIYLDNPTNIIVNIFGNNINEDEFIKYIFQLEFIRENGDFSLNQFKSKLDEAFHRYIERYKPRRKAEDFSNPYNTNAYSRYLNKIIIQALGRICRTNMKAPKIHILADASIRKHLIGFSLPEDVIPIREYTALLELAGKSTNQSEDLIAAQNRASHKSNQTATYIRRQLNTPWTNQSVKKWQELREQVLYQPGIAKESECNINWSNIYLHLLNPDNSYYFSHENDYDDIEVFFTDDYGKREIKEVSERTARLLELMKIDSFYKLFTDSGWATTFPKSKLMLTPPMFNNIYKGALGEVCGKHIFQNLLNIPLLELNVDEFELFDFKTEQNVYIDFKLWNDRVAVKANEIIEKICEKMKIVEAEKVFVINILGSSNTPFIPIPSFDGKIIEIPYLCKNDKIDDFALKFIVNEFLK